MADPIELHERRGGRGFDRSALLMLALSSCNNANAAAAAGGTAPTNSMQQLLPLLLMLGRDDGDRGLEDVLAVLALTQGTLDTNSLIAGMLLGRGGGWDDRLYEFLGRDRDRKTSGR